MTRRHPLIRVHHIWIRFWARRRARSAVGLPLAAAPPGLATLLRGRVDEPVPDEQVDGLGFTVRGWCAWGGRPALAVTVCVDGVPVGRSAVGSVPRPDVADALRDETLCDTGWRVQVGPGAWKTGEQVDLTVLVWVDPNVPPFVLDQFCVTVSGEVKNESREFVGQLDQPAPGEWVDEVFPVRGWAMRGGHAISRLDVLVNGERIGRARLGLPTLGLGSNGPPSAVISGFEHWVDLTSVSKVASTAKLQLVARSADEEVAVPLFERVVRVRPAPEADQSDRTPVLARRRERLLSTISMPRSTDLDLVVFTHQLDYGGGQLWLDEFLKRAGAGTRFGCTVISFKDGPLREAAEERGIAVHVTDAPPVDDPEAYEGRVTELAALVAGGGHNVALVNTAPVFSGADVASRLGLPTVWAIHESFTPKVLMAVAFGSKIHPRLFDAARGAMEAADAVVFEAEATRDLYAAWERPGRAVVVPYGVDTTEILDYARDAYRRSARTDVGVPPESRTILVMGTIEQRKAQTRIAQAFRKVAREHSEWNVVFVGDAKSDYSDALKSYIRHMGLSDRCTVVPIDGDVYRWYSAADLLLSASDVESLPRSMLEAMCFGVPVVSASVFGVSELVMDGETGFLFEANDLDALVAALHRVLSLEPSALARVGDAGRRHVLDYHDSSGYAGDLIRLCEGFLHRPGATAEEILSERGRRVDELDLDAAL